LYTRSLRAAVLRAVGSSSAVRLRQCLTVQTFCACDQAFVNCARLTTQAVRRIDKPHACDGRPGSSQAVRKFSVCGCELRRVRRRVIVTLMGMCMPTSIKNARARAARVPRIAAALSLFAVLLAPLCAFATAPTISGIRPTGAIVGVLYTFQPKAADADGNTLTFSITNKPTWATFSATTGKLSGTPSSASIKTYSNIVIKVSDGTSSAATPAFSITVRAATDNRAPTISRTPPTAVTVGAYYYFMPAAADPDGNPLTFSIQNKPSWLTFYPATGRLSGTAPKSAIGTSSNIVIKVSDGVASASLPPFSITVSSSGTTNKPPVISGTPSTSVKS